MIAIWRKGVAAMVWGAWVCVMWAELVLSITVHISCAASIVYGAVVGEVFAFLAALLASVCDHFLGVKASSLFGAPGWGEYYKSCMQRNHSNQDKEGARKSQNGTHVAGSVARVEAIKEDKVCEREPGWTNHTIREKIGMVRKGQEDGERKSMSLANALEISRRRAAAWRSCEGGQRGGKGNREGCLVNGQNGAAALVSTSAKTGPSHRASTFKKAPIILVHGIFGFGHGKCGKLSYFGGAELKDESVLVPDLGSLTSIHDRACELFFYLKGGTVDYGQEHSLQSRHDRYGRKYFKGHYEEWGTECPLHFVGHSSGVQVIRLLQTMLEEKAFEDHEETTANWVASVTSLSGALNGTTRVYLDGLCPADGRSMQMVSLLQVLRLGVLLFEWADIRPLKKFYSFGFDHFGLSWRRRGILGLFDSLFSRSGPFASGDWILPDLSIQSSMQLNLRLKTYPCTFYFSYATSKTRRLMGRRVPASWAIHPLFSVRSLQMTLWRHPPLLPPPYPGYLDEDWHDNDGAMNTFSMLFPRVPSAHPNHPLTPSLCATSAYRPGIWYYTLLDADHIYFIINPRRAGSRFHKLYDSIFNRVRKQLDPCNISISNGVTTYSCTCPSHYPRAIQDFSQGAQSI